jgi:hypothetical protein
MANVMHKMVNHTPIELIEGSKGILKHFNNIEEIFPLYLVNFIYESTNLKISLFSPNQPPKFSPKWSSDLNGGCYLNFISFTNEFNINCPAIGELAYIQLESCTIPAVQWNENEWLETQYQGVKVNIFQNENLVISSKGSSFDFSGIQPTDITTNLAYTKPQGNA